MCNCLCGVGLHQPALTPTTLFFAFSVVLHLMLLLLISLQLYIPTTRQIVFTAPSHIVGGVILPRRVIRHLRQSLRDNPVSPPHIATSEYF
jgi:hypothetical protein